MFVQCPRNLVREAKASFDPQGSYSVLYAATQRVSCFVETLARFRSDLALIAELQAIAGEDDDVPLGSVPSDW